MWPILIAATAEKQTSAAKIGQDPKLFFFFFLHDWHEQPTQIIITMVGETIYYTKKSKQNYLEMGVYGHIEFNYWEIVKDNELCTK